MSDLNGVRLSEEDSGLEPEPKPLTPEEAAMLRPKIVGFSPWHVIGVQSLVGLLMVLVVWRMSGQAAWGKSVGYGALAVLVPAV